MTLTMSLSAQDRVRKMLAESERDRLATFLEAIRTVQELATQLEELGVDEGEAFWELQDAVTVAEDRLLEQAVAPDLQTFLQLVYEQLVEIAQVAA